MNNAVLTFRVFCNSTREPLDIVEMHVLAKAYRAAWRAVHAEDPRGYHVIEAVDLLIDYGDTAGGAAGPK